jgi:hypothetical protein
VQAATQTAAKIIGETAGASDSDLAQGVVAQWLG